MGGTESEETHLETAKDVSLGVCEGFALLEDDRAGEVVVVFTNQRLEP